MDIKNKLLTINNPNSIYNIRFTWCPAHCGIQGNEMADKLAKEAALSGELLNNKLEFNQIISQFRNHYGEIDTLFQQSLNNNAGVYYMEGLREVALMKKNY